MLINVLIFFFIFIIIYELILANHVVEGFVEGLDSSSSYQSYNTNDPNNTLILAQQNAGNIQVLKGELDGLTGSTQKINSLTSTVHGLQKQVSQLTASMKQMSQSIGGKSSSKENTDDDTD